MATNKKTKPIVQETKDGQLIAVYPSKGGAKIIIEPKADKYKKQD